MNRSVNGDVVVVEVLPEEEWKAPGDSVVDQDGASLSPSFNLSFAVRSEV